MTDTFDPFDQPESAPALSFKDAPAGTTYTGVVTREADWVHSRDYETGELSYWDDNKERPKMAAVLNISINGEERSVWAVKPSAMFAAIAAAQQANGVRIAVGDTIAVTYTGDKPNEKNPRLNPIKQYSVVVTRTDPFGAAAAAPPATPASTPPAAPPVAPPAPAAVTAPPAVTAAPAGVPQMGVAPATNGVSPTVAANAGSVLDQIKGLLALGMTDEQIRMVLPLVTPEILTAVKQIPGVGVG